MKRKIISIILILICTICIIGNTSITNADASEYSYENFLDSYNDNDYIKLEDFYNLLDKKVIFFNSKVKYIITMIFIIFICSISFSIIINDIYKLILRIFNNKRRGLK